jgi:DNA-3-methyladenine glycosylase
MGCRSVTVASSCRRPVRRRLRRAFFDRATVRVARELLGALLTVRDGSRSRTVRVVETEAYVAGDPANHAFRGRTGRNRSMFGPPGTLYVYRIHQVVCANLVTRPGEAVLLRAGAPRTAGLPSTSGPGRLCRGLGIGLADDGLDVTRGRRVVVRARPRRPQGIAVGPRVGIRRAADRPLRFAVRGEPAVSRPRPPSWATSAAWPRRSPGAAGRRRTRRRRRRPSGGGTSVSRTGGR